MTTDTIPGALALACRAVTPAAPRDAVAGVMPAWVASPASVEEASAVLQVKDQTLKSRLHRGRLILRKQLADFAGGLTLHRPIYGT